MTAHTRLPHEQAGNSHEFESGKAVRVTEKSTESGSMFLHSNTASEHSVFDSIQNMFCHMSLTGATYVWISWFWTCKFMKLYFQKKRSITPSPCYDSTQKLYFQKKEV